MPFGVGERNGGTLAPRKRVDASPRIRDKEKETRRAFQPVMDNVINVPTTRYGGMVSVLRTRGGLGRGAAACARSRPLVRARGSRAVHVLACCNCAQVELPEAGVRGGRDTDERFACVELPAPPPAPPGSPTPCRRRRRAAEASAPVWLRGPGDGSALAPAEPGALAWRNHYCRGRHE